tara:strand:+ start:865 stop:1794 length:930 start_codon:yes stop_codon:yes gene_type:complete
MTLLGCRSNIKNIKFLGEAMNSIGEVYLETYTIGGFSIHYLHDMDSLQKNSIRYVATVEYDGSFFYGWQKQKELATVQYVLENALSKVGNNNINVVGAGRTDTGVHALQQVAHFESINVRAPLSWLRGANTLLPKAVSILSVSEVLPEFHARFTAVGRTYRYIVLNRSVAPTYLHRRVTWDYRTLDIYRMREAAKYLIGEHDFNAYRATSCQSKSSVRNLRKLEISSKDEWIWFDVEAGSFLHHMVRNLVGVLLSIGAGEEKPIWAKTVLESRNRGAGGVTADPDGLYLVSVAYPSKYNIPCGTNVRFW